jgi:4-carboxymuconolactone decarboxylase
MQSRLHLPSPDTLSPAQKAIHDSVLRTRGNVQGPFLAWLLSPGLADPAQQLGAFCRYGTSLSLQESELLILLVAAQYDCAGEQQIHEPIARKAGLGDEVLRAIRARQVPPLETPRLRLVAEVAGELLSSKKIADALYARGVAQLGETTLVELVGIVGYYALVAYTLNAFDMRPD